MVTTLVSENRSTSPFSRQLEVVSIETTLVDAYATILETDVGPWMGQKLITVRCTHGSNSLKYSIFASSEDTPEAADWITLVGAGGATAEQTVLADVTDYQTTDVVWKTIRVQCKNGSGGAASSTRVVLRSVLGTR